MKSVELTVGDKFIVNDGYSAYNQETGIKIRPFFDKGTIVIGFAILRETNIRFTPCHWKIEIQKIYDQTN